MSIKESQWDSGPKTYSVVLRLMNGGFEKYENAIALETRLRARLHLG